MMIMKNDVCNLTVSHGIVFFNEKTIQSTINSICQPILTHKGKNILGLECCGHLKGEWHVFFEK